MYLRRLEVYGFKSFANEMTLELAPGITVLVGPNGGGKSNVVDAVRWVLGEQRLRELRAEHWEDLLYAGGPGRRSAQLAEAFLEFDNTDGAMPGWPDVLRVGRRLYRQGESEYLIGSRVVRLRDVTDLFLDSGLGRSAYAIIGQGRVEATLTQRPQERLEQLEEVAGTTRYKVRRREARQHLQQVMGELTRAADLEAQVTGELEQNRTAAAEERRYLELDGERQALFARVRAAEVRRLRHELSEVEAGEREQAAQTEALTGELQVMLEQQAALQAQLGALNLEHDASTRAVQEVGRTVQRLNTELGEVKARREGVERLLAELEETLAESSPGDVLSAEQEEADHAARRAEAARAQEERTRALEGLQAAVRGARSRYESREAEVRAMRRQLEDQVRIRAQVARFSPDPDLDPSRVVVQLQAELTELEAEQARLDEERQQRETHLHQLGQYLEQQTGEVRLMEQHFAQRQARHRALHQLEAEGEGLQAGVRAVLMAQAEGQLQGIHGTLSSLVETDDRYMVAVQAALGAAAQNLVADSERHARAAVRHLQTRGLGRATFLALDIVRGSRPSADDRDLIHQAGVVGWAMDLIRVRPEFRPAAQHALGRVLVLEALDDAVVVGRLISFRYRLVTLDGQIIHPGGAITGGSPASTGAVWVRKQEIERLGRELVVELQRLDGARERVAGVEQERDQVTVRLREIEALVRPLRERLAETRSRVTALHELTTTVGWDGDPARLEAELATRVQEARAADAQLGSLEERLRTLREEDAAGRARLDEVDQVWTRRREELARLKTERDRAQARRLERERRRESLLQEREAGAERLRLATSERDAKEAELALLLDRQRTADESRSGHERELRQIAERTRALEAELRRRERQREHLSDRHERLLFQLEQLGEAAAPSEETGEEDVPALRMRLSIVEAELQGIGPITPGSVALEDRLTERVAFLQHHRADIERAVAELEQTIADLDREVESRRTATAAELEAAVRRAVQELFGGGAARFEWTSEPEPGLELWVEPPSKRPQSLQSLSGGEKALGALAWLFALLALRPAPLVVLDEVEASLDELNARRFAQHLKRNRNVQYLVVSHHKPTMEQADALWGFSSDSHGVSRLVSVRLGEESGVS